MSEVHDFIYGQIFPILRGFSFFPLLILIVLCTLGFLWIRWSEKKEVTPKILWTGYGVAFLLQLIFFSLKPTGLSTAVANDNANSFHTAALSVSAWELLTDYSVASKKLSMHAESNMPGKTLLFHFLHLFTRSPLLLGYLLVLISNLGGILTYGVSLRLGLQKQTALRAAFFYYFLPGKLYFLPLLNTVTPVLWLGIFALFLTGRWAFLLGVSFYLLFLFEPTPFITGPVFLLFLWHYQRKISYPTKIILGSLGTHFLLKFTFGLDALGIFLDLARLNGDFYQTHPFPLWPLRRTLEFLISVGLAYLVLTARLFISKEKLPKEITLWGAGFLITFLFLLASGVNRSEVTRLWIFMSVPFPVLAASALSKYSCRATALTIALIFTQAVFQQWTTGFLFIP